jgi:pantetheine-phosphate adenylyltransferase
MPTIAMYAGSFDPITNGHSDLIKRSFGFVDRLVVAVSNNISKQPLFSIEERTGLIRAALDDDPRVEVRPFEGLLVEFAKSSGVKMIIRGLRAVSDFEYEYQMALMNRHLAPQLETVFMVPSLDTTYISSSLVREIARFHGDYSNLVHPVVGAALKAKFSEA